MWWDQRGGHLAEAVTQRPAGKVRALAHFIENRTEVIEPPGDPMAPGHVGRWGKQESDIMTLVTHRLLE